MFKKLFHIRILILIIVFNVCVSEFRLAQRLKIISSLSRQLFIKNVILINKPSFLGDVKIISYAKKLSQSNIYFSFLSAVEIEFKIADYYQDSFLKSLIVAYEEKSNDLVYELITRNKMGAWKFTWVAWDYETRIKAKMKELYIPYNCQLLIVEDNADNSSYISEVYHPGRKRSVMFKRHFGIWSENKRLEIFERDLYKRRFNMSETELGIVYRRGYSRPDVIRDFIQAISHAMNFRLLPIPVKEYNVQIQLNDEIGPWEIDLKPRFYDYTNVDLYLIIGLIWRKPSYLHIRYDSMLEHYASYLHPFSAELWQAILISIALTGLSTCLLNYIKTRSRIISGVSFVSSLYHPIEAFMNQYGGETSGEKSMPVIIATTRIIALFIVPAYSAFILTFILHPNVKLPFTDMKGFVQDGSYRIGFSKVQNWDNWFKLTKDPWSRLAYEKYSLGLDEMPETMEEVEEKICYQTKKVAYLLFEDYAYLIPCKIVKIPTCITTAWYGIRLRENSSYHTIFNRIFKTFHSSGLFDKYDNARKSKQLLLQKFQGARIQNQVQIESTIPVLQVMAWLYIISVIILIFECLYKRVTNFLRKSHQYL